MGKRGRPRKKPGIRKKPKINDCYELPSSNEDEEVKEKPIHLPPPNIRRRSARQRKSPVISTLPMRTTRSMTALEKTILSEQTSIDMQTVEPTAEQGSEPEPETEPNPERESNSDQQIKADQTETNVKSSNDSDATEVYSMSEQESKITLPQKSAPKKRKVKAPSLPIVTKANHDLSDNSEDELFYSRRPIIIRPKRRQQTSSSSSSFSSDDSQAASKKQRPPIPAFIKRTEQKVQQKDNEKKPDEDHQIDVENMDDKDLVKKTERRMLNDEDLTQMTKKALEEERQRVQRIQDRQSTITNISRLIEQAEPMAKLNTEGNKEKKHDEPKLVFEYETKSHTPLIFVHPELVAKMKPHQIHGTRFLWDNVYESTAQIKIGNPGTGCILAHHMGLGKTFQLISFLHAVFKHGDLTKARTCLILCPVNVISNWAAEFSYWLTGLRPTVKVHQFSLFKTKSARWERLEKWNEKGGVMLMGYEIYRRMSNDSDYNFFLSDPGPDLIVCDEGHVLKNQNAGISRALNKIRTKRRIILTGTPLQNNLKEYYFMVHFVKPHLLGTYREFKNQFIDPIRGGQHKDSNIYAVQLMKRRAFALHERLKHCTHRCDFNVLRKYLPEKYEYVIKIYMGDLQKQLYNEYLKIQNIDPTAGLNTAKLFADYQYLMKIWTHPWLLRPHFIDRWKKQQKKDTDECEKIDPFFNDVTGVSDDEVANEEKIEKKSSSKKKSSSTKSKNGDSSSRRPLIDDEDDGHSSSNSSSSTSEFLALFNNTGWKQYQANSVARSSVTNGTDPCQNAMQDEWWFSFFDETAEFDIQLSGKLMFLKAMLDECERIGDKVLLFSRSLFSLTFLEQFLKHWDSMATGKIIQADDFDAKVKANSRWKFGVDYFRIDGSTDITTRTNYIAKFNDDTNIRSRLFIVSTMAGGIGINLTGSNRVVIFDCSWNPSSDLQALFRSYRLGQKKATYVYRLLSKGSMEEKIYFRQVNKQAMAQRVVDAQQLARHFTESELRELYSFKLDENEGQEYLRKSIPNDFILRYCLEKHPNLVQDILEHDSLLENHIEEQLTREEKYYAIKELEQEERKAEYQSTVAKTLASMAQNNSMANIAKESRLDRKLTQLPPINSYNPYQPPPPMCAQARVSLSTASEARGLERLTELLFPKDVGSLTSETKPELPPLRELSDIPISKEELNELGLDEDDLDPRTKKEKQKALLQEQRALVKLYNDKRKLLKAPKEPKLPKKAKNIPAINTPIVSNPYQFMPITLNPFDLPPSMQKRPD